MGGVGGVGWREEAGGGTFRESDGKEEEEEESEEMNKECGRYERRWRR